MFPIIQTVSTKGQLVIPKAFRKSLNIEPGTKVSLTIEPESKTLKVTPMEKDPIKAALGVLRPKTGPSPFKRMLQDKYEEIKRGE